MDPSLDSKKETAVKKEEQRLINIIKAYRKIRKDNSDAWIEYAKEQSSIKSAIKVSALCINRFNKRHPHQYRLEQRVLNAACDELLFLERKIKASQ